MGIFDSNLLLKSLRRGEPPGHGDDTSRIKGHDEKGSCDLARHGKNHGDLPGKSWYHVVNVDITNWKDPPCYENGKIHDFFYGDDGDFP